MKIRIRNALEFVKYSEDEIEGNANSSFSEIISLIKDRYKPKSDKIRYSIVKGSEFKPITDFTKSLNDYSFKESDSLLVEPISLFEVPTYLVTVISYIGPPLIFNYLLLTNLANLDYVKILATLLINAHFLRRIYESTFIFQNGRERLAFSDLLGVSLYYWILNGVVMGSSIFSADLTQKNSSGDLVKVFLLTLGFFFCERGNSSCHIYLANLKKANNGQRGIPQGGMFNYVTCAHYFWELMSWACFSLIVNLLWAYLFVVFSFLSMAFMALDKHKSMKKFFGEKYPQKRTSFIPFLL